MFTTLKKPPKLYIDKEVEDIDSDIVEVEKEAAATSYQRIKKLEARQDGTMIPRIDAFADLTWKNLACSK